MKGTLVRREYAGLYERLVFPTTPRRRACLVVVGRPGTGCAWGQPSHTHTSHMDASLQSIARRGYIPVDASWAGRFLAGRAAVTSPFQTKSLNRRDTGLLVRWRGRRECGFSFLFDSPMFVPICLFHPRPVPTQLGHLGRVCCWILIHRSVSLQDLLGVTTPTVGYRSTSVHEEMVRSLVSSEAEGSDSVLCNVVVCAWDRQMSLGSWRILVHIRLRLIHTK